MMIMIARTCSITRHMIKIENWLTFLYLGFFCLSYISNSNVKIADDGAALGVFLEVASTCILQVTPDI